MGGDGHEQYMRKLNLERKSSEATGLKENVSSCDSIGRVWN